MGDFSTGLALAYGIMLALFIRERTGVGQEVDASGTSERLRERVGSRCVLNHAVVRAVMADSIVVTALPPSKIERKRLVPGYFGKCSRI